MNVKQSMFGILMGKEKRLDFQRKFDEIKKMACLECKQAFFVMQTRLLRNANKPCLKINDIFI
jgi:hypothetical protein